MPARLFVVATPIGNLADITLRAVETLKQVTLIAAEDTRRTAILLRHYGVTTRTTSLHAHNEREKTPLILEKLADGNDVALVSDAGTPVVSDPGQRLIRAAIDASVRVIPIPGPSAVMAALGVCGWPADEFLFAGFPPVRTNALLSWLKKISAYTGPVVFFEAPHRIKKTLQAMADVLGERPITLNRELTKLHEEIIRTTPRNGVELVKQPRGEFTVVLAPIASSESPRDIVIDDRAIYDCFCRMTETKRLSRRQAISATAHEFGLSTNLVYSAVERAKKSSRS